MSGSGEEEEFGDDFRLVLINFFDFGFGYTHPGKISEISRIQ